MSDQGKKLYDVYYNAVKGVNFMGHPLPQYGELNETRKIGWEAIGKRYGNYKYAHQPRDQIKITFGSEVTPPFKEQILVKMAENFDGFIWRMEKLVWDPRDDAVEYTFKKHAAPKETGWWSYLGY